MSIFRFDTSRGTHLLGKKKARPGAVKFKLGDYVDLAKIVVPKTFGHVTSTISWGELGNDKVGDCVVAGAYHETMLWSRAITKTPTTVDETTALNTYKQASGWNGVYNDPSDTGLDMEEFASIRRKDGIKDAKGNMHKVLAYARCQNLDDLIKATYVFGACGVGVQFPASAADQFDQQKPWDVVSHSQIEGGHYIPCVARNSAGNLLCVTWGRLQAMTPRWVDKYVDEIVAYISMEYIDQKTNLTPEKFDLAKLQADLSQLSA